MFTYLYFVLLSQFILCILYNYEHGTIFLINKKIKKKKKHTQLSLTTHRK